MNWKLKVEPVYMDLKEEEVDGKMPGSSQEVNRLQGTLEGFVRK